MTRVDLSREERMAKYDELTFNLLDLFKHERVRKYSNPKKASESSELSSAAQ